MPEVITKHPDVVKQVLESAGARCGTGDPPQILTKCPREQFCRLPGGEICVYAVKDIPAMTQLSRAELCGARTEAHPASGGLARGAADWSLGAMLPAVLAAAVVLRRRRGSPGRVRGR